MSKRRPKPIEVVECKLGRQDVVGLAYPQERIVEIDPRQCPSKYLDTLIHEALHIEFPERGERKILRAGHAIAKVVWQMGFRKIEEL